MVSIRRATVDDLLYMHNCNLWCLPENYTAKYYFYHFLSYQNLLLVAEDPTGKIVGYVLAKVEEEEEQEVHSHITSLSVLRSHRRLGIAQQLMQATHEEMQNIYDVAYCSLQVRVGNRAAIGLYKDKLKYEVYELDKGYYADGEDAYNMRRYFKPEKRESPSPYEQYLSTQGGQSTEQVASAQTVPQPPPQQSQEEQPQASQSQQNAPESDATKQQAKKKKQKR